MKFLSYLFVGLLSAGSLFAGGIGGPFNNYSPLQSGIDGFYQATARGENLTGIITFSYDKGMPVTGSEKNSWIMFVNGQIIRGQTNATIDENKIAGILNSSIWRSSDDSETKTISLPLIILNDGTSTAGYFRGNIDLKSVNARFNGRGEIVPAPASTSELIVVGAPDTNGIIPVTNVIFNTASGSITPTEFRFTGYRTTTTFTSGTNSNTQTNVSP